MPGVNDKKEKLPLLLSVITTPCAGSRSSSLPGPSPLLGPLEIRFQLFPPVAVLPSHYDRMEPALHARRLAGLAAQANQKNARSTVQ